MTLKGIVRGNVIELQDNVELPDGTEVKVVVEKTPPAGSPSREFRRGSPQALAEYLKTPTNVTAEDVDELMRLIKEGRSPADFRGIFDEEPQT
jgi:hypothetical protein